MKKTLTFLAIALVLCVGFKPLSAQETKKWDARLGLSIAPIQDVVGLLTVGLGEYVDGDISSSSGFYPLISPSLEMSYKCNEYISVGAQLSLGFANEEYRYSNSELKGNSFLFCPTLMANLRVNYFNKNNFSMYGLFGLGASNYLIVNNDPYSSIGLNYFVIPNFNFYPLCFSTNRDNGFYMEVGYGSKGYLNLGWEIKIKSKEYEKNM